MGRTSKLIAALIAVIMILTNIAIPNIFASSQTDLSYPAQTVKIMAYGGARALNITGYGDDSKLNTYHLNGTQNENWRIDYVSEGVYEIVNVTADRLVSLEGNSATANTYCVLKTKSGDNTQKWRIEGVQQDFVGNYLYYKITNYANSNLALTWNTVTHEITVKNYTGANNQKWKLNLDGLDGFAGNCIVDEGEKAGTIGGLLGQTVFVSTSAEFKENLAKTEPLTIVVTANISDMGTADKEFRIEDNKTVIGSYSNNTLHDPRLVTSDYWQEYETSHNIVLKNLTFSVETIEDRMAVSVYGSKNIWIDHCTFTSQLGLYYDEVGKYIWINEEASTGKNPDFVTISYNVFNRRYWGVAFGANALGEDRATVMYNKFVSIVNRAPQLGNGKLHVVNNYYLRAEAALENDGYGSIKCGDGSEVYSDAQRFEGYQKESSGYWDNEVTTGSNNTFKDVGSYTDKGETPVSTPYPYVAPDCTVTTWDPATNYGYKIMSAYSDNDVKAFCNNYSGAVASFDDLKYIHYTDCSSYVTKSVASPVAFDYTDPSDESEETTKEPIEAVCDLEDGIYMIKNKYSGLYLEVADANAANGANVQQGSATFPGEGHNNWKIVSTGEGYYQFYPQIGDGDLVLDVDYSNAADGTNVQIWSNDNSDGKFFKINKESDGSYAILTKASVDTSGLDVSEMSKEDGANVLQWTYSGASNQKWIFEKVTQSSTDSDDATPSYSSDAVKDGAVYMIKNVNSGLYLDVNQGLAQNGTNVQQWSATFPGNGNNTWKVVSSGDGYYQLYPQIGNGDLALDVSYADAANGTNVQIWANDNSAGKFFKFQLNDDGTYSILTKASNDASCLDVYNLSTENGGNVVQWTYTGGANQKWILQMVREQDVSINGRYMEYLDRGVVAVSTGSSVFVSWRLLESDDPMVGFNIYRTTEGVTTKLNTYPLFGGTNYTDTTADLTKDNTYFVKTVSADVEESTAGDYTIPANSIAQAITIPINAGGTIHFVWVGDFNADGRYDYLVDRLWGETQLLEAYLHDGTYLWTVDLGYNSTNTDNIEPGASTIDVGMWDGATVYDIDCDGSAEVLLRIADGVVFGDGSTYTNSTTDGQAIAVINGMTGALEASAAVPDDMISAGPKACMMEVGYLDGKKPSLVCWLKNRNDDKTFNSYMVAYGYVNGQFKQQWKYTNPGYAEAHNIRIADVDYDGSDEVLHMGYALNGDGSLRYTVDKVVHGDRWYVGSFCNDNNGNEMMGYGIQQDNESGLLEYFYNASTGKLIWTNYAAEGTADVARGNVGDVDPNYDGFECWSFQGLYSMSGEQIYTDSLYPVLRLWWDGDLLSESYNDGKIEEWDYNNNWTNRVLTTWKVTDCTGSDRGVPMFYGDILGDWREEIVMTSSDYSKLVILSTTIATDYRLDCLAQNICYRNCMTGKGYYQSHMLDYFLGSEMEFPNGGESDDNIYSTADFQSTSHGPMTNGVIEMDITPFTVADNVIGITSSTSAPTWYDQLNIVINLAADGTMKAYNGGALASYETISYEANKKYHIYIETKVANSTYSAWVTDEAGNKYTLALNYAYRSSAPEASDLGKLTLVGGWEVGGKLFAATNVQFYNTLRKEVTYILNDANGNEVERWTDGPRSVETGDVLYNFPQGEVYGEINNKAYIVKSATDQVYVVADDNNDTHTVTLEIVHENAVLADTFADVDGNSNDSAADMLFIGSAGVSDASDTDADGNATVTGSGYNLSNPRIPLLTFDVPDDYENGKAVKLNVYVASAHDHLGGGNSMKLAANSVNVTVNESSGYDTDNVGSLENLVWSDGMFRMPSGSNTVNTWVSIDVTEFVQNATGDTVTFALYAPRAAAYVPDRESASAGGAYMGKAAYLEVVEGETIVATGMEKVTKLGSLIQNPASFVVPVNSTVKFYATANVGAYAVTNGTDVYTLTSNATEVINPVAGSYYLKKLEGDVIYSTEGINEGFVTTSHGPITKGIIDMDFVLFSKEDAVIAISSSTSNPTWYGQSNIQINFTPEGQIQAYNKTGLDTTSALEYEVGKKYHLHIETDVVTATYSAWITDEDGNEYTLATDYVYRDGVDAAADLGKLLVIGGYEVEAGVFAVSNVVFESAVTKTVTYTINDADGVYKTWTVGPEQFALDEVLYDFPQGEFYYELNGKAYILSSDAAQSYTVADDGNDEHAVTLTLVHENAVIYDTFADNDANNNNASADMLFVGSSGVSDALDTDEDGNATVTGSGYNMGAPRIPVLTFNVPDDYQKGKAVKLNVYVAKAHTHLGGGNSMKLAANTVDFTVNEETGYSAAAVASLENLVWSYNMFRLPPSTDVVGAWVSIDVTEFVEAASDTVTFTLYAPRAAAYVVDRESAMQGGNYAGKAAYLEVVDGKVVETSGALKITKNGSALKNNESFVITDSDSIRFYSDDESIVAFTDGTKVYKVETAVNCEAGSYTPAALGVSTIDGAQVRIGDGVDESGKITGTESGLRFITEIDKADSLAAVEGATFGVSITAEDSDSVVDIPATKWQSDDVFTSALTNLAESNYNRKFTATPYVTVDNQTFYGEAVTRSIYQVAAGLLVTGSTDGTEYDSETIGSSVLYKVLNAYVNQTGIRLSVTSEGLTEYTGTGTSAYSGSQFFEVVSAEEASENVYTITIKPLGEKTVIASYWQEYIRINNNNSKIKSFTSLTENADGSVTIKFDYAAYLNQ